MDNYEPLRTTQTGLTAIADTQYTTPMTYIAQPDCHLGATPDQLHRAWCVIEYQVYFEAVPESMLIVACKLTDAWTLAEANRNSEWRKWVTPNHMVLSKIHGIGSKLECQMEATKMILARPVRPRCNLYGYNAFAQVRPIKCSNGRVYQTQAEASADTGCAQSHISRHLKGELKHVKGLIFAYKD